MDVLRQHILQFTSKLHQLEDSKRVEKEKYKEMKSKLRHQLDLHQNEVALRNEEERALKERVSIHHIFSCWCYSITPSIVKSVPYRGPFYY